MNIGKLTFLACIALPGSVAVAQQTIVAPSPESTASFDLYPAPDASQPPRQIKVADAGLPLTVQARQGGYLKVEIGGQPWWIRGTKVRLSRPTTASCGALATVAARPLTASTPGASDDACGKAN